MTQLAADDIARPTVKSELQQTTLTQRWGRTLSWLETQQIDDPIDVDSQCLKAYVSYRRARGIRGQTIVRELHDLKRALSNALEQSFIKKLPKFPTISFDPKDEAHSGKMHDDWVCVVVLASASENVREGAWFCLATGLRSHELQRVRWTDLEIVNSRDIGAIYHLPAASAKGRRNRVVGVPKALLPTLEARHNTYGDILFPHKNYVKGLDRACKRLGLSRNVTLRDMRHAFATLAYDMTNDMAAVMAAMGHTRPQTTWIYITPNKAKALTLTAKMTGEAARPKQPDQFAVAADRFVSERNVLGLSMESRGIEPLTSGLQSLATREVIEESRSVITRENPRITKPNGADPARPNGQTGAVDLAMRVTILEYKRSRVTCNRCGKSADVEEGPGMLECLFCGGRCGRDAEV